MKNNTLFITYNPRQQEEQTLAVRLHTIGAANGFRVFLPDRFNSDRVLAAETQRRIDESDYFVLFSLTANLSPVVADEMTYAWRRFKDKGRILVIYKQEGEKSLHPEASKFCTEIYYNPSLQSMDSVLHKIMDVLFQKQSKLKNDKQLENSLLALLGIGLGLLALNEFAKE